MLRKAKTNHCRELHGQGSRVAAMFIYSFTGIHRFWLLEISWAFRGLRSWDGYVFFFLTVVQGVGSGGWQHLLGQALHLVRDVASAGPLGWKEH